MAGGAPGKTSGSAAKAEKTAENVRKKGHDLADTARSGVSTVRETIDSAGDYAQKAQEVIAMAEERLDQFIDQAEKLFAKGTKYTGTVKSFVDNNPQYKERAQNLMVKYHEYSEKLRSKAQAKMSGQGEGPSVSEKGKEAMESAKAKGREQASVLSAQAKSTFQSSAQYIRENPAEAVLVGAAVGVLIGTAFRHMRTEEVQYYEGQGGTPYGAI
jgi:ElaB/YqjD/DUF883 family membrane-anchored ribosome-binding protein